jgi:hypothetical protein
MRRRAEGFRKDRAGGGVNQMLAEGMEDIEGRPLKRQNEEPRLTFGERLAIARQKMHSMCTTSNRHREQA